MDYLGMKILLTFLKRVGAELLSVLCGNRHSSDYFIKEKEFLSILIGIIIMMVGLSLFWIYAL